MGPVDLAETQAHTLLRRPPHLRANTHDTRSMLPSLPIVLYVRLLCLVKVGLWAIVLIAPGSRSARHAMLVAIIARELSSSAYSASRRQPPSDRIADDLGGFPGDVNALDLDEAGMVRQTPWGARAPNWKGGVVEQAHGRTLRMQAYAQLVLVRRATRPPFPDFSSPRA